ncbi:hypothetical protein COMNV_01006 [Commensalibacter sp. Nvir]|uniref:LolA family protein n=1 Tax=Commensalibacter sp. Nvir TaxID=3069817 RepID=UPI002D4C9214|nr:hypothetical protein COMNV_01006 [Commensalibacter sp. Nvir]
MFVKFVRWFTFLLSFFLLIGCQTVNQSQSTCDLIAISRVEDYLNNSSGFIGQFEQTWPDSNHSRGQIIYLPGKLRLNYRYPFLMVAVAKDRRMVVKDYNSQSLTQIGLNHNPLGLMLNNPVRLQNSILVTSVKHTVNFLQISLASSDNPSQGLLTLRFRDNGKELNLIQMLAIDARQRQTIVTINNIHRGINIDPAYFSYPQ